MHICSLISQLIYLSFIRNDRVYGRGGGVGIMIHNDFCIISSNFLLFSYSDGLSITLKSSIDIIF